LPGVPGQPRLSSPGSCPTEVVLCVSLAMSLWEVVGGRVGSCQGSLFDRSCQGTTPHGAGLAPQGERERVPPHPLPPSGAGWLHIHMRSPPSPPLVKVKGREGWAPAGGRRQDDLLVGIRREGGAMPRAPAPSKARGHPPPPPRHTVRWTVGGGEPQEPWPGPLTPSDRPSAAPVCGECGPRRRLHRADRQGSCPRPSSEWWTPSQAGVPPRCGVKAKGCGEIFFVFVCVGGG